MSLLIPIRRLDSLLCDINVFYFALYCFVITESGGMATSAKVGTSLEKHGITEDSLLAFVSCSGKSQPTLQSSEVTNETNILSVGSLT